MGQFMYFPENKLEYIPGLISLLVFVIIAILVFRLIRKISNKELEKAKKIEQQIIKGQQEDQEYTNQHPN